MTTPTTHYRSSVTDGEQSREMGEGSVQRQHAIKQRQQGWAQQYNEHVRRSQATGNYSEFQVRNKVIYKIPLMPLTNKQIAIYVFLYFIMQYMITNMLYKLCLHSWKKGCYTLG